MPPLARFGPFDAVAELRRTALHRVYLARDANHAETGQILVKVLDPAVPLPRRELAERAAELVARAELQRSLAQASSAWAAVLHVESGGSVKPATASMETILSDAKPAPPLAADDPFATPATEASGGKPFVATEFAGESPTTLVSRGVAWSNVALWQLADSVVAALRTLAVHYSRGHGRLEPKRVLVRPAGPGAKGLARGRIVVTEPMTPGEADAATAGGRDLFAADARALGRLLYEVVEGRPPTNAEVHDGLPATAAWQQLGGGGRRWLSACTTLLQAGSNESWSVDATEAAISSAKPGFLSRLRS